MATRYRKNQLLPSHLSDLLYRLHKTERSYIELFDSKQEDMHTIARELRAIASQVEEMQKTTNTTRMMGAVLGVVGVAVGAAAVASAGAEKLAVLGATAAVCGSAGVVAANVSKVATEKISITTVEKLGNQFMAIIALLKDALEEIKEVSEELKEKSSSLLTTTRAQAKRSLSETQQLQELLGQTAELAGRSREVMGQTLAMLRQVRELLNFIILISQVIPTHEDDMKLHRCITDSALQCEKTVHEFSKMRNLLKNFEEMQTE